jgi:hypothetical protein
MVGWRPPNVAGRRSPVRPVTFKFSVARVLWPFLATRAFILLIGYLSTLVVPKEQWFHDPQNLRDLFFNWDAGWYHAIVKEGYQYTPGQESNVAFFPLFPLLVRLLALTGLDVKIAGYLIANVSLFLACAYFYRLLRLDDHDDEFAARAVWYLLVAPVSFFFSSFYTEGLFLLLVVAAFYHARRSTWWAASLCACLASATRSVGVLLAVPLLLEYLGVDHGRWRPQLRRIRADVLYLGLIPLGLLAYMAYLQVAFGDALAFSRATATWHRTFVPLTTTFGQLHIYAPFYQFLFLGAVGMSLVLLAVLVYRRVRLSYTVFTAMLIFLYLSSNILDSIPRYLAVLFPLYIGLACVSERSARWHDIITLASVMFLTLSTILFTNGYWLV